MPTVGERLIRSHALGRLNRLKKLRASKMKKTAADRTPMLNQVGEVLKRSGYDYEKPADIIKRVIAKGKVLPEQTAKLSAGSAGPTSSHHQTGIRRTGKLDIPQDDTNPKLAGSFLGRTLGGLMGKSKALGRAAKPVAATTKAASAATKPFTSPKWTGGASKPMYSGVDVSRALGSDPSKGWERLGEAEAREMLKHAIAGALVGVARSIAGGITRMAPKIGPKIVGGAKSVGRFAARRPITTGAATGSLMAPSRGPQMPSMRATTPMGGMR